MKDLPYTTSIVNKVITEIEKFSVEPILSVANAEFIAGAEYAKEQIVKHLKKKEFD